MPIVLDSKRVLHLLYVVMKRSQLPAFFIAGLLIVVHGSAAISGYSEGQRLEERLDRLENEITRLQTIQKMHGTENVLAAKQLLAFTVRITELTVKTNTLWNMLVVAIVGIIAQFFEMIFRYVKQKRENT